MALLELEDVTAGYGDNLILRHFDLSVERGELVSLLGPSGCGKTTTLRLVGGFSEPVSGKVMFDGKDITKVPPHKRNFGFVFQSYALFPHMTIFDNVAYGLRMRKVPNAEIAKRVPEMLHVVDLDGYGERYPKELSGGQRQRVALARALVVKPSLLLMDEPLSNLDAKLRMKMRVEIRRIQQELGVTTVYVTHDQEECFAISDKVAIMNGGVIEQMDTPTAIYNRPRTEFVTNFVGFENRIELAPTSVSGVFETPDGSEFTVAETVEGEHVAGFIRPDDVTICSGEPADKNVLAGTVSVKTYLGKKYQYDVETALGDLVVRSEDASPAVGDAIRLVLQPEKLILIAQR